MWWDRTQCDFWRLFKKCDLIRPKILIKKKISVILPHPHAINTTNNHINVDPGRLEDRRNVGESSCSFGDGTDQRVQSLMFMMMMMMMRYSYPIRGQKWSLVLQEVEVTRISRYFTHEFGKVVNPTHRPPLSASRYSSYSYPLLSESTPVAQCGRKEYVNEKSQ